MLFRPTFCSNCGEKIERSEWHIWTSRRFCEICVTDMPIQEYAPKIVVAFGILATVLGLISYLRPASNDFGMPLTRQRKVENSNLTERSSVKSDLPAINENTSQTNTVQALQAPRSLAAITPPNNETKVKTEAVEQYFCGAITKKGTPCSRRVKGNVRCYQHHGMPSMVSAEKLRAE